MVQLSSSATQLPDRQGEISPIEVEKNGMRVVIVGAGPAGLISALNLIQEGISPKYKAGLAGFDNWIHALDTGKADGFGMAYNAAVWSECHNFAV